MTTCVAARRALADYLNTDDDARARLAAALACYDYPAIEALLDEALAAAGSPPAQSTAIH